MGETTHQVLFEGGPFHGRVATFNAPPPNHSKINRGQYDMVGRTETGLFLLRWTGAKAIDPVAAYYRGDWGKA